MNHYYVIEGEVTESRAYPFWISQVLPNLSPIDFYYQAVENHYYIFSGGGIPSIYDHIINAIKDVNKHPVFSHLIVCVDGEEVGSERRKNIIRRKIQKSGVVLREECTLKIIVQNPCIETWFLGNRKFFKHNPQGELLREYLKHYSVFQDNPEYMSALAPHPNKASFHFSYLREIWKEYGESYKKSNPKVVLNKLFLKEMKKRTIETEHLISFKELIEFWESLPNSSSL